LVGRTSINSTSDEEALWEDSSLFIIVFYSTAMSVEKTRRESFKWERTFSHQEPAAKCNRVVFQLHTKHNKFHKPHTFGAEEKSLKIKVKSVHHNNA